MMGIKSIIHRIKNSDIGRRMMYGAFWSVAGTALGKCVVLVASIVCAHILSKEQYGEFGIIRSTVNMFVVFGSAGLGLTASKYISEYKSVNKEKIPSIYLLTNGFAFVTGLIITVVVFFFAPYLANKYLNAPHLLNPLRVGVFLLFVTVINGAQTGTLSGFEDFKSIAINTFFGSIAESVFMLVGAYFWGLIGAILGFGTGYLVIYVLHNVSIKKDLRVNNIKASLKDFRAKDIRLLYNFSLPAMLSSMMVAPAYWIVKSILARSGGFEELAGFEAADQWRTIILFLPSSISHIALPILSSLSCGSNNRYWRTFWLNMGLNGGVAFVMATLVSCLSPFIMGFYGSSYTSDSMTLIILSASTVFSSMASVVGASIYSRAKSWTGFAFNTVWAMMLISFSFLFLKQGLGAKGIALAILISYTVHTFLQLMYMVFTFKRKEI